MTSILVTSAGRANGDGYGAILGFSADGSLIGPFSQDRRITDPRSLSHDQTGELLYVNSGDDRVLVLDRRGEVALDSGRIDDLDPGGAVFGPDGRYYVGLRRRRNHSTGALARVFAPDPATGFPRPRGLRFGSDGRLYCVGQDHVIAFDFITGTCLGVAVRLPRLNGQALALWERKTSR